MNTNRTGENIFDADVKAPRALTPAFYGCFDWHSSVHGHWLLARLVRWFPEGEFAPQARRALDASLTASNIAQEVKYLNAEGRSSFERPYGLEQAVTARIAGWLPKLAYPIRGGEHNNTAFAMGLMLDYAAASGNRQFGRLVAQRARDYYLRDRDCPIGQAR